MHTDVTVPRQTAYLRVHTIYERHITMNKRVFYFVWPKTCLVALHLAIISLNSPASVLRYDHWGRLGIHWEFQYAIGQEFPWQMPKSTDPERRSAQLDILCARIMKNVSAIQWRDASSFHMSLALQVRNAVHTIRTVEQTSRFGRQTFGRVNRTSVSHVHPFSSWNKIIKYVNLY